MSDSAWPHRRQPTRLPRPWDSPDKNTGVGCLFLLQCMKVRSEREVTQSCPTLRNPWTAAYQAPPSMGFSRQEYWSGVPLPKPRALNKLVKSGLSKQWTMSLLDAILGLISLAGWSPELTKQASMVTTELVEMTVLFSDGENMVLGLLQKEQSLLDFLRSCLSEHIRPSPQLLCTDPLLINHGEWG